jgi:hypothetical protein
VRHDQLSKIEVRAGGMGVVLGSVDRLLAPERLVRLAPDIEQRKPDVASVALAQRRELAALLGAPPPRTDERSPISPRGKRRGSGTIHALRIPHPAAVVWRFSDVKGKLREVRLR